jgi:dTMP kinase
VLDLNLQAVQGLMPDLTVLLLVDPATAGPRAGATDRLEREGAVLQTAADAAYRELAERFPERILTLDGTLPADELSELIRERLRSRI